MAASYTFKIASGGEFRRITVTPSTTLAALRQTLFGEGPFPRLSYFDDEGDRILLATEADLAECFSFAETSGAKVLRLQAETPSSSSSSSSSVPPPDYLPSPYSSHPAQGGSVPRKALEKLEKIDRKISAKNAKCARKLAWLMQDPAFSRAEFEAKRSAVEQTGVPLVPVVELMIAKRMLHRGGGCGRARGGCGRRGRGWKKWWSMDALASDSDSGSGSEGEGADPAPFPCDDKHHPHPHHGQHHGQHHGPHHGHHFHGHHGQHHAHAHVHAHGHHQGHAHAHAHGHPFPGHQSHGLQQGPHHGHGHGHGHGCQHRQNPHELPRQRPWCRLFFCGLSEETQGRLEVLRAQGLPAGPWVGRLLEAKGRLEGETSPLLERQLAEVEHLKNVPRAIKVYILKSFSPKDSC